MTGVAPGVRTHSVREAQKFGGYRYLVCRGCGEWFDLDADRDLIERQPCGTRAPDPGSEAETSG